MTKVLPAVGHFALVTDFHDDGVEVNNRVYTLQTAALPGFDFLDDGVGGVGNYGGGDLDFVDLEKVLLDLVHADAWE